jgi:hypothetical protein
MGYPVPDLDSVVGIVSPIDGTESTAQDGSVPVRQSAPKADALVDKKCAAQRKPALSRDPN